MKKATMQTALRAAGLAFISTVLALPGQPVLALDGSAGVGASAAVSAATAGADSMAVVRESANNAQKRCNELGHDNADEYVSCTDALFKAVKGKSAKATQARLGVLYFGWVGAEHWARVGLPGSEEAAKRYFLQFRPLQQQLHLTDETLCGALAGDCKVRLAQVGNAVRDYVPASKPAGQRKN